MKRLAVIGLLLATALFGAAIAHARDRRRRRPVRQLRRRLHPPLAAARPRRAGHASTSTPRSKPPTGHDRRSFAGSRSRSTATAGSPPTGLPACNAGSARVDQPQVALERCRHALVGRGQFAANVEFPDRAPFPVHGQMLAFNGRSHGQSGDPAAHPRLEPGRGDRRAHLHDPPPRQRASSAPCCQPRSPASPPTSATSPTSRSSSTAGTSTAASGYSFLSARCAAPSGFPGSDLLLHPGHLLLRRRQADRHHADPRTARFARRASFRSIVRRAGRSRPGCADTGVVRALGWRPAVGPTALRGGGDRAARLRPPQPARARARLLADPGAHRRVFARTIDTLLKQSTVLEWHEESARSDQITGLENREKLEADIEFRIGSEAGNHVLVLFELDGLAGLQRPLRLRRRRRAAAQLRRQSRLLGGAARGDRLPQRRRPLRRSRSGRRQPAGRDGAGGDGVAAGRRQRHVARARPTARWRSPARPRTPSSPCQSPDSGSPPTSSASTARRGARRTPC